MSVQILVVSNCQSYGLANSMRQLAPQAAVTALPGLRLRKGDFPEGFSTEYDLVFCLNEFAGDLERVVSADRCIRIPALYFDRFHPDIAGVMAGTTPVLGPTDAYHSLIAFAAYLAGRDIREAKAAFNAETFEYAGYFSGWSEARDQLFEDYAECDMDVKQDYLSWMRKGCFMLSHNHPRIFTLFSTARLALQNAGVPMLPVEDGILPDNLLNAAVMPVYPEIAERLGLKGSYIFKKHGTIRAVELETFLRKCFAVYDEHDRDELRVRQPVVPLLNRMKEYLA